MNATMLACHIGACHRRERPNLTQIRLSLSRPRSVLYPTAPHSNDHALTLNFSPSRSLSPPQSTEMSRPGTSADHARRGCVSVTSLTS